LSALEAITEAQKIVFAPFLFQAAWALKQLGILSELEKVQKDGLTAVELSDILGIDVYGIGVLLNMGLSGKLVWREEEKFHLGKVGHFILNDHMTQINMEFSQHVCYQPISYLVESIQNGKPEGLKVFGDWETIYPGLNSLPEPARSSWFHFDHFYSDQAFTDALPQVFAKKPKRLYDFGGNTGKWALKCIEFDSEVHVSIVDLPEQTSLTDYIITQHDAGSRISTLPLDVLTSETFPKDADVIWMSQFLDCFSKDEIIHILSKARSSLKQGSRLFIMELLGDRQRFEAATFSLNATSLYFTCLANGKSRFYDSEDIISCIKSAGFSIINDIDELGFGHTLFECVASES